MAVRKKNLRKRMGLISKKLREDILTGKVNLIFSDITHEQIVEAFRINGKKNHTIEKLCKVTNIL